MASERDRRNDRSVDGSVAVAASAGKGPLIDDAGPALDHSAPASAAERLETVIDVAERAVDQLESAISAFDFDAAVTGLALVTDCLASVEAVAAQARTTSTPRVRAIRARARRALARAPEPGPDDEMIAASAMGIDESPSRIARKQRWLASMGNASREPADVAERGVASATAPLPHRDQIQASFGRHSIAGVRSHIGGSAADAASELGARAYAVGDRIGFASAPDLHTAAHEAAHVVQQRRGVQLKAAIDGGAGDPHEQHADAVADKVVRGESAEALLDQVAGGSGAAAVQRKDDERPRGMINAREYLHQNFFRAREAIGKLLVEQRLPDPHPRLEWRNEHKLLESLLLALYTTFDKFTDPHHLVQSLFPHDPYVLIDEMRPLSKYVEGADKKDDMVGGRVGTPNWLPAIGTGLAQMFEQVLTDSVYRIGPRIVEWADAHDQEPGPVELVASAIARSHPIDRIVVPVVCADGMLQLLPDATPKKKGAKKALRKEHKDLKLTWIGKDNHELWNWVSVSPADATPEEVSAKIFEYMIKRDHDANPDYYAAFLTAAPPLYGIPPQWAKTFEETKDFRPPPDKIPADNDPDHQLATLGGNTASDDQALIEMGASPTAKVKPHPASDHDNLVADVESQTRFVQASLSGWKLGGAAAKTLAFLARRKGDAKDAAKWVPVLSAQRENLTKIAGGIGQLNTAVDEMKISKTSPQASALHEIARFYADATATSHLNQTCNHLLMRAAGAQSALTMQGLTASIRDMDLSADAMRAGVKVGDYDRDQTSTRVTAIDREAADMQTRMMRGQKVNPADLENLQLRAESRSLEARFAAIEFQLSELRSAASEANAGVAAWIAARFSGKFRNLPDAISAISHKIGDIKHQWDSDRNYADMPDDDATLHTEENLKKAVRNARAAFTKLQNNVGDNEDIHTFLKEGAEIIKYQQIRTACVKLAALIGISLVGGFVGGMIMRGVAGMMMGTSGAVAMENLTLGGSMIARGAGLVTETAIVSAGQAAVFGDNFSDAFLENMITSLGSAGVLKLLGNKVEEAVRLEKSTSRLWQSSKNTGKLIIREGAALTGHTVMGIAMGYVAHKIVTGQSQPPPATLEEWMMQGAGIAVGRYVGHAMEASRARQQRLKLKGIEPAAKLAHDTEAVAELAKRVEDHPQAKDAMELLEKRHHLLTEEMKLLEELERSPERMKTAKLGKGDITKAKAELRHQMAEIHGQGFGDVPLHLAGMHELIPGALWSGTKAQVEHALRTASESGIAIHVTEDPQGGKWHVEIEGKKLEIERRFDTAEPRPKSTMADDHHGAVRGNTYDLSGKLGPSSLENGIKPLLKGDLAAGATVVKVPAPAGAGGAAHYHMQVPHGSGAPTAVEIAIHISDALPESTSHGANAGPARFALKRPVKPGDPWTAEIHLDRRVKDRDVRFVVGHEFDEIALIAHADTPAASIAHETESHLFRADPIPGDHAVTLHDQASARELIRIVMDVQSTLDPAGATTMTDAALKRIHDPNVAQPALQTKLDRMDGLMEEMGLYKSERRGEKLKAIQAAGPVAPGVIAALEKFITVRGAFRAHQGGRAQKPGSFVSEKVIEHLLYPDATTASFETVGIGGGHHDGMLHDFVRAHPEYTLTLLKTKGDFAVYEQTLVKGIPLAPIVSLRPKSTFKNLPAFLAEADAAVQAYFRANPPTGSFTNLALGAANGGPIVKGASGVEIGGYVDYDLPTNQYSVRSLYPDATWIRK